MKWQEQDAGWILYHMMHNAPIWTEHQQQRSLSPHILSVIFPKSTNQWLPMLYGSMWDQGLPSGPACGHPVISPQIFRSCSKRFTERKMENDTGLISLLGKRSTSSSQVSRWANEVFLAPVEIDEKLLSACVGVNFRISAYLVSRHFSTTVKGIILSAAMV